MVGSAEDCLGIRVQARGGDVLARIDASDAAYLSQFRWRLTKGYAVREEWEAGTRRSVRMHREILGLVPGDGVQADHINRDRLDNRRSNLRVATAAQNRQNVPNRGGTSRFRGVSLFKRTGKWEAQSMLNGRHIYHGCFDDEIEAARAAQAFRDEHMPYAQPDPELAKLEEVANAA